MLSQRLFQGTSATSAPFPVLETTSPCGPEKAIFSSALIVNRLDAVGRLSIVGWTGSRKKNSFFCMSNAGMLLKTKDRRGKGWAEAGMLLIAKEISSESGNVIENKEDRRFLKAVTRTCCRPLRPPLTGPCRPSNLHKRLRRNIAKGFAILSCQACAGRRGDPWSAVVGPIPPCGIGQGRGKPRPYMNPQFEGRGLVLATFPKEPHYEKSYRSWRNILQS